MRVRNWSIALFAIAVLGASGPTLGDGVTVPKFVDETASAGINTVYAGDWFFIVGGGVATFDCNADGFPDLLLPGGAGSAQLYRNASTVGGPLKFVPWQSGLELDSVSGAYPLDIDSDGIMDLVLLRVGENVVMRGLGNCQFERANERWSFDGGDAWSTALSATWEKGASWPTVAIGNYIDRNEEVSPWGSCTENWLHRPQASGTAFAPPFPLKPSYCALSMLFTDWNRSGTPSCASPMTGSTTRADRSRCGNCFPARTPTLLTEADGWKRLRIWGMGIASYDLDGDGYPEYFLTSMADNKLQALAAPSGDGSPKPDFKDIAFAKGVTAHRPYMGTDLRPSTAWHAQFDDVNNDGLVDLFVAKGNVDQMPDFAMADPDNLLLQIARWQVHRGRRSCGDIGQRRSRAAPHSPTLTWTACSTWWSPTAARMRRSGATLPPTPATGSNSRSSSPRPTSMRSAPGSRSSEAMPSCAANSPSAVATPAARPAGGISGSAAKRQQPPASSGPMGHAANGRGLMPAASTCSSVARRPNPSRLAAELTEVVAFDPRFHSLVPSNGARVRVHDACAFTEGPVWFGDHQLLLWSDIPNNRILRWTPDGHVGVFREDSHFANGNTRDREGRLVTCEHGARRVTRTEIDGSITVIADRFEGNRLNSPNDVVVKSDGSIWFTDPDYGLRQNLPGIAREQNHDNVFRVDPASGRISAVVSDFVKPNGLAFSPDEAILYIADSAVSDDPSLPSHIRAFRVGDDGTLSGGEVFVTTVGIPDGLRIDTDGNVWTSAGPGVNVYTPRAEALGRIGFEVDVTNLTFGGVGRRQIFVTAGTSVYAVDVLAAGAQRP